MKAWVALLRSVNVGGSGKTWDGATYVTCAADCGFVQCAHPYRQRQCRAGEARWTRGQRSSTCWRSGSPPMWGRHIAVLVRGWRAEMAAVLAANHFPEANAQPDRGVLSR